MGSPCELRFDTDTGAAFSGAVRKCIDEVRRFERKYSRYRPDSVTAAINRAAGREPVPIDGETAALLRYAAVCHEQSGGAFDITSGPFRHVWHRGRTTLPSRGGAGCVRGESRMGQGAALRTPRASAPAGHGAGFRRGRQGVRRRRRGPGVPGMPESATDW